MGDILRELRALTAATWRFLALLWRRRLAYPVHWYGPTVGLGVAMAVLLAMAGTAVRMTPGQLLLAYGFMTAGIGLGSWAAARGAAQGRDRREREAGGVGRHARVGR